MSDEELTDELDAAVTLSGLAKRVRKVEAEVATLATAVGVALPPTAPPPVPAPVPIPAPTPPPTPAPGGQVVALVNESTLVSDADVTAWAKALVVQAGHIASAWNLPTWYVVGPVKIAAVPAGAIPLVCLNDADQAGALGYHGVDPHGRPYGRCFMRDSIDNQVDPASVVSHEFCEIVLDPGCDQWEDTPEGSKFAAYAREACDPVESGSYRIGDISVSDFVLPAYFDRAAPATAVVSHDGAVGPFKVQKGGYQIVRDAHGSETQVFASEAEYPTPDDDYPEWKIPDKVFPAARSTRRKTAGWVGFDFVPGSGGWGAPAPVDSL